MKKKEQLKLTKWFIHSKREFPWRKDLTPYKVWISEVMLQQTRASVVIPYFERWMKLFPTIGHLANASHDAVIKAWEGLGYYSRARNLHLGAKDIQERFDGNLPSNRIDLLSIKGIGDYTVGALLSFAFHQKATAVDGNVIRVLSRYFLVEDDIGKSKTRKKITRLAEKSLPKEKPWVFNEALIELGAVICQKKPLCSKCPLQLSCSAYREEKEEILPYKEKREKVTLLSRIVIVLLYKNKILITRREEGKVMQDLHEFPYIEQSMKGVSGKEVSNYIENNWGISARHEHNLNPIKHSFTRYRAKLYPMIFTSDDDRDVEGMIWVENHSVESLAFSSGHKKVLENVLAKAPVGGKYDHTVFEKKAEKKS